MTRYTFILSKELASGMRPNEYAQVLAKMHGMILEEVWSDTDPLCRQCGHTDLHHDGLEHCRFEDCSCKEYV